MPRTTTKELERIVKRIGIGISTKIGKGVSTGKDSGAGAIDDVERTAEQGVEGKKSLQVNYTGKVRVSIKFYRHRLADYSRAISEKALIDCLQYSGLIRGDSEKEIWLIDEGQCKVEEKSLEKTEITLEYGDVDFDNLWVATGRTDGR